MASNTARSFNTFVGTETSNVRYVDDKMLLLDQDRTPLYVLTNAAKRKEQVYTPRIEWLEDADIAMLGTCGTAISSVATGIAVTDVTLFGVNDVIQIANASATNATQDELALVTAVTGTTIGTLTVTRGFASTTADTCGTNAKLKILFVCQTENGSIDNPRSPLKAGKTSGCQIFEWPIQITRTAASTRVYGAPEGDRAYQQMLGMRRQKLEIENAGLFGKFAESLSSPGSRYSSQGVRSIISTNVTDAATTLTYTSFLSFSRTAFRYGSPEKFFAAAPVVKEALDYFAAKSSSNAARTEDKQFGISLKRFVTSNGTWILANNFNMDGGVSDEAIGIDLASVSFCVLSENGISNDTQIIENYDPTNPKIIKDLVYTQGGWKPKFEARHSRIYDASAYS